MGKTTGKTKAAGKTGKAKTAKMKPASTKKGGRKKHAPTDPHGGHDGHGHGHDKH
jgi:hypothetical protein